MLKKYILLVYKIDTYKLKIHIITFIIISGDMTC
jgi:hypothetical protein